VVTLESSGSHGEKLCHAFSITLSTSLRRVVTAHDGALGTVRADGPLLSQAYPGQSTSRFGVVWTFDRVPTNDNNIEDDGAEREVKGPGLGIVHEGGAACRYSDLAPGARVPMHRTTSVDLNILVHGELVLIMEDGSETHLKTPGDTVVQRGTAHGWYNPGDTYARIVSFIIDAKPVLVEGKELQNGFLDASQNERK